MIPFAAGTLTDCARYLTTPFLTNSSSNTTSTSCTDAAAQYRVGISDFILWNPSLNSSTNGNCMLQSGYNYCARTYDVQSSATQYCTEWDITQTGFGCEQFANLYGIGLDQFVLWNPEVGADCSNYTLGACLSFFASRASVTRVLSSMSMLLYELD